MLTLSSGSRLGDLGWHTQFTPEGAPLNNGTLHNYGKVCLMSRRMISLGDSFLQTALALQVLIWPCVGLQKISVLLLYKRIFIGQTLSRIIWCFIGMCVAWTIAFEFSVVCTPHSNCHNYYNILQLAN